MIKDHIGLIAMAKAKESPIVKETKDKSSSSGSNYSRSFIFNQEEYQRFEEKTRRFNVSPGMLFRKVVADYTNDRYINVDELEPQTLAALEAFAQKSGMKKLQNVIIYILDEWVKEKSKAK